MIGHRDGTRVAMCDTCYRVIDRDDAIIAEGPPRRARLRDKERVFDGGTVRDPLHFCNADCQREYEAPKRHDA